jgi:hypothetical protein
METKNARYIRATTHFVSIKHNIRQFFPHFAVAFGYQVGMLPENWSILCESIIDEFSILLFLNLGGYTYAKALQRATDYWQLKFMSLDFILGS